MTAASNNQNMPISQVGLSAWGLAQRAAAPAAIGDRIARRVAGMVPPDSWPALISRYALAAVHTPPAELTLLQRLASADRAFETERADAWLKPAEMPRLATSGTAGVTPLPGKALPQTGAAVQRATPASPASAPTEAMMPIHRSALQAVLPASAGAPAQSRVATVPPIERVAHTALPGTVGLRRMPLPLVLAPPTAVSAPSVPGENGPLAPAQSALQRQAIRRVAPAGGARATVIDSTQPGQNTDQDDRNGQEGQDGQEMISAPQTIGVPPARAASRVQHTAGIYTAPDALPPPPMLAPILRRAVLATGTPARPALLDRMAEAITARPLPDEQQYLAVSPASQAGQLPFSAVSWPDRHMPNRPVAGQPRLPAEGAQGQAAHGVAHEQASTAPLRSSLQRLLHAERHGTLAAPILMRTRSSQPAEPGENTTTPAPAQPVAMRSGAERTNVEQQPIGAAPVALPIQRLAAAQAAHDSAWHMGSPAMASAYAAKAQQQALAGQSDTFELPDQATPVSVPARSMIVAPSVQRLAHTGSVEVVQAREPHSTAGMNWDALPLVARVLQRGFASGSGEGARAPIGHAARTAEQWSAHKAAALARAPGQGNQTQPEQPAAPGSPGMLHAAPLETPDAASFDAADDMAAGSAQHRPTGEHAAALPPAVQRAHQHAAADTQSAQSGPPLLRTALPALEHQPDGGPVAPAMQRRSPSQQAPASESPDRWRIPVREASAPLQRADTLDMLRPLPGNIQRAEQATLPAEQAVNAAVSAALPGQPQRDNAGSAVSSLSSVEQLDIEALAQKVYDHLRRQMRIDRERLGR